MPLTKQELLIPRVMSVGGKEGEPNDTSGDFISGEILIQKFKDKPEKWYNERLQFSVRLKPEWIFKFTHLFKSLPWWYGRTVEEMPLYLKSIRNESFVIVKEYRIEHGCFMTDEQFPESLSLFEPADESEYQEYQKQKQ